MGERIVKEALARQPHAGPASPPQADGVAERIPCPDHQAQPMPLRLLSAPERALWHLDRACCLNGVQVAHVRGPLQPEHLEEGLARVQDRHPPWRVHIEDQGAELRFVDGPRRPVPLRVVPRTEATAWLAHAEQELNAAFQPEDHPLFRVTLVAGAQESEIIVSHHHVVADALSIVYRLAELLEHASARLTGRPSPLPLASLPLRPALGNLLRGRGPRRLLDMGSYLMRQAGARLRGARKLRYDAWAEPQARRTRLLHAVLEAPQAAALRARCHQEGTTVHGLLAAALLGALCADPGTPAVLGCFSTVSLRGALREPVGTETGLFVSQATTYHALSAEGELWELARQVRRRLQQALGWGEPHMTFPWLGLLLPHGANPGPRLVRRLDLRVPAAVGITNAGQLPIPTHYGPLELTGLHLALGAGTVVPLLLGATGLGGRLLLNLLHVEPLLGRERALGVQRRLLALLRAAAGPGPVPVALADQLCDPPEA
ncbi:MAG: condensation domain-containing protein [Myxococcales bacterium]|nr:condensation domain-containing protein [Myxococcales bacterium]